MCSSFLNQVKKIVLYRGTLGIDSIPVVGPPCRGGRYYQKKIIDSRYIDIFKTFRQIIVVEKNRFGNYRKIIVIKNVRLISSDKHCSKNKSKRVFHIPNEYEFVLENSTQN